MALLKVTLTPAFVPILVDEFGGATATMVGAAVSAAVPGMKLGTVALHRHAIGIGHTRHCIPDIAMLATRLLVGVMLMTCPPPMSDSVGVR